MKMGQVLQPNSRFSSILVIALFGIATLLSGCSPENKAGVATDTSKSRTILTAPLPDSGFRLEWLPTVVPVLKAGQIMTVPVTVKNAGDQEWSATGVSPGDLTYAVGLGYRWLRDGEQLGWYDSNGRVLLPNNVRPGESVTISTEVKAPQEPGTYQLQFDLVQEKVSWFEAKGAPKQLIEIRVDR